MTDPTVIGWAVFGAYFLGLAMGALSVWLSSDK